MRPMPSHNNSQYRYIAVSIETSGVSVRCNTATWRSTRYWRWSIYKWCYHKSPVHFKYCSYRHCISSHTKLTLSIIVALNITVIDISRHLIWCNRICWHALMFKKHISFQILYIIVGLLCPARKEGGGWGDYLLLWVFLFHQMNIMILLNAGYEAFCVFGAPMK